MDEKPGKPFPSEILDERPPLHVSIVVRAICRVLGPILRPYLRKRREALDRKLHQMMREPNWTDRLVRPTYVNGRVYNGNPDYVEVFTVSGLRIERLVKDGNAIEYIGYVPTTIWEMVCDCL